MHRTLKPIKWPSMETFSTICYPVLCWHLMYIRVWEQLTDIHASIQYKGDECRNECHWPSGATISSWRTYKWILWLYSMNGLCNAFDYAGQTLIGSYDQPEVWCKWNKLPNPDLVKVHKPRCKKCVFVKRIIYGFELSGKSFNAKQKWEYGSPRIVCPSPVLTPGSTPLTSSSSTAAS